MTIADQAKFVRPNKGLPSTFLIIDEGKSIGGEAIWIVMEFGYSSKTFGALKSDVHSIKPDGFMSEQLSGWLRMINFAPELSTLNLWANL